jgi:N-acetylglucosamine-6-sulfatase
VRKGFGKSLVAPVLAAGLAAGAAFLGSGAKSEAAPQQQGSRPNIVVVMTDDQTVESLRVMGNVRTLLANQGVTFDNSFASFPLCCPSRATFLTGQYGHNHRVMGNAPPNGGYDRLDHSNTLPVWLQRAGYATVHVGKYLNGYGRVRQTEVPTGWIEWYGSIDPSTYRFYNYTVNENGRLVSYGATPADYQADVYTRRAVDIIRRHAADPRPLFLSVAYLAPHSGGPREPDDPRNQATPVPAPRHRNLFASQALPMPPSFNEADVSDKPSGIRTRPLIGPARINGIRENYRQRLESLLAVDEGVAEIVRTLEATGQLGRTYILFTADNGFFHGEHRVPAGKTLVYEPSIRVPLIIRGPTIPRGGRRSQLVANIDLAPTIAAAARVRPGRAPDGRSLLPIARDRLLFGGRDILLETPTYAAIRTPRWVYVEHANGDRELYDLLRDPRQLTSQHANAAFQSTRTELAARLMRLRGCSGATCRQAPVLRLFASFRRGARGCARTNVRLGVGGGSARRISQVHFYVRGRLIRRDARRPFTAVIPRRLLRRPAVMHAVVTLTDSRRHTLPRAFRACR